jgi:hypothetical protein
MQKTITPHISLQLSYEDEPYVVRFVLSGWSQPKLYHVIQEYGDMDQSEYAGLMTSEQIKEKFSIDVNLEETSLKGIVKKEPNDQLLGREIRDKVYSLIKTV